MLTRCTKCNDVFIVPDQLSVPTVECPNCVTALRISPEADLPHVERPVNRSVILLEFILRNELKRRTDQRLAKVSSDCQIAWPSNNAQPQSPASMRDSP